MEKRIMTLSNKETLAYIETDKEKKETLLLVHGNMSSGVHYEPIIKELADRYHILAPDLRGFGDSTYTEPIDSLEDLAKDLSLFIENKGIDSFHVAGWSTGGGIAMKMAAILPDCVKKVILIESCSPKGYPIFKKDENMQPIPGELYQTKEEMAKDPVQVLPPAQAMEKKDKNFMRQVWSSLIYNVQEPPSEDYDRYLDETLKQRNLIDIDWALMTFNMTNEHNGLVEGDGSIADVQADILAFWGKKDLVIPEVMFKQTTEAFPGAKTHIFENAGHSPITDVTEELAERMDAFLRQ